QAQGRPLRIWSAACSSGEEPYSVAILLRRIFPHLQPGTVSIFATDINSHVLSRAGRGLFTEWSFRDTPDWLKQSYFTRKPNGRYDIDPDVRKMVKFSHLNLADATYPREFDEKADFDLILCRNVLMYFSAEWHAKIVRRLVAALSREGWLLVGPCDISIPQATELGLIQCGPGVFQHGQGAAAVAAQKAIAERALPPALWPAWPESAPSAAARAPEPAQIAAKSDATQVADARTAASAAATTESEVVSALAQQKADRGDLSEALAACDDAIALDKVNPNFHYLRGCILQEQNRMAEATQAFQRVLFLDPETVMAHFALGCIAERLGDAREARRQYALVLRLLGGHNRGDAVPGADGLTVGRLQAVVENNLRHDAA
ncbi:MAG: CheR family methyltransferase, partial [Verrucomicrobiota bacterium]